MIPRPFVKRFAIGSSNCWLGAFPDFNRQLHVNYYQLDFSAWYLVVVQHARNFFAQNSRLVIIPVLGPVLRTCIKDLYYGSTDFLNTGPNEPFPFHKKIRPVSTVKSEFPGYNGKREFSQPQK